MDIAINGHGPLDSSVLLHFADRNGDIVDHAKSLAVVRKGMVETAAEVDAHAIPKREVSGKDRSAGHQPKRFDQRPAIGHFKFEFFADRESSGSQLVNVYRSVCQKDVLVVGGLWLDKILRDGCTEFEQAVAYKPILLAWKNVMPEREQISIAVNQTERQHRKQCPEPQNVYSPGNLLGNATVGAGIG
jgi:hypothetical protein